MIAQYSILLPACKRGFHIITEEVMRHIPVLPETGVMHVFIQHTSAALTLNENAAEILIAPHHGHRNQSTPAFLNAVQPRYILLATGYRNRYGYPRPNTVARYQATGATLLDPADEGALTFRVEPGRVLEPERYRRDQRRYWHGQ